MRVADLLEIPQPFEKYPFYIIQRLIVGLFCSLLYAMEISPISDWTQQAEKAQKSTRWDQRSLLLQTLFGGGRILFPCYS